MSDGATPAVVAPGAPPLDPLAHPLVAVPEDCSGEGLDALPRWFRAWAGPWTTAVLVPLLLLDPLVHLDAAPPAWRAALAGVAASAAGGLLLARRARTRWLAHGCLVVEALLTAAVLTAVPEWSILGTLLAVVAAVAVPARATLPVVIAVATGVGVSLAAGGAPAAEVGPAVLTAVLAGVLCWSLTQLFGLVTELSRARRLLAVTAVAEERLRFGRDLHDLLGHTLSLIVVKAEAVRRLASLDPAAAAEHARDIETVGRRALAEVRQAVDGYRGTGLLPELERARAALAAAKVSAELPSEVGTLPAPVDDLLGWAVREGVTNVVRHAGARHCRVTLTRTDGRVRLEVADDGRPTAVLRPGTGLTGLRERVDAVGGTLHTVPTPAGFRLVVAAPAEGAGAE